MLLRLLLVACLALLVISPTQAGIEIAPKFYLTPADPLVWLTLLLWLTIMVRRHGLRLAGIGLRSVPLPVLFLVGWAALSIVAAGQRGTAIKEVVQLAEYFVAALLVFSICRNARLRAAAVQVFLVTAAVVIAIAHIQYWTPGIDNFAVRGTFGNANVLGGYLALALPIMFGLALYDRDPTRRLWLPIVTTLGTVVVFSGGTLLGLAAAFTVMAAVRGRWTLAGTLAGIALWLLVLLPQLARDNLDILYRSLALFTDDGTLTARYPEWQAAAVMILENPWLGVGIGNYQANIGMYYGMIPNVPVAAQPDTQNLYLVLASSIGVPGLLAFAGILALFARRAGRAFCVCTDPFDRGLALGVAGALLAFAINCVWSPLLVRGIGIPLAFLLALATALNDAAPSTAA